jgi:hypothetical protein
VVEVFVKNSLPVTLIFIVISIILKGRKGDLQKQNGLWLIMAVLV